MILRLHAIGTRPPAWVLDGYESFRKRLPRECALELVELPTARRARNQGAEISRQRDGETLLKSVPDSAHVVALDERGQAWSTDRLVERLQDWMQSGRDVSLLVGGPDGLSPACLQRADERWSLSALTLPHAMVRVLVAEALYRAWTVHSGHPYHRA